MSILNWLNARKENSSKKRLDLPGDLWVKCPACGELLYLKELENNFKVCPHCGHHFRLSPQERVEIVFDHNTFEETQDHLSPIDFLDFSDTKDYKSRIESALKKTQHLDAILIGKAQLKHIPVNVGLMDFDFMGGSMGSVVGEKITRLIEQGYENENPVIMFTASGGARMQEGIMSLMQMAKTSSALNLLAEKKVPFISVLCDPTTGGTSASFAMLGDVNLAEPNALISFAGPRVIEQTINQKLPKGFQRSEFLLEKGMLDKVVERKKLRDTLFQIVSLLGKQEVFAS